VPARQTSRIERVTEPAFDRLIRISARAEIDWLVDVTRRNSASQFGRTLVKVGFKIQAGESPTLNAQAARNRQTAVLTSAVWVDRLLRNAG
jgi:hypothetical protein